MEWQTEPNHMSFLHCGLKCEIKRNPFGSLNIYVFLPESNIHFGLDEDQLNSIIKPEREITYTIQQGNLWQIGCDFGHLNDFSPNLKEDLQPEFMKQMEEFFGYKGVTSKDYKNFEYAIDRVKNLAERLVVNSTT